MSTLMTREEENHVACNSLDVEVIEENASVQLVSLVVYKIII
jgi:hypothetical protein